MAGLWNTIGIASTADGPLELHRHENGEFLIMIDGRVLMVSDASSSEIALGELACRALPPGDAPLVLSSGLGMGCTLRAALDLLPPQATVEVCEMTEAVVRWCRGPLTSLNGDALADTRVRVHHVDVAMHIAQRAQDETAPRFDAIILDLNVGPQAGVGADNDPFYGTNALANVRAALSTSGVFAVWGEAPDSAFERRLVSAGFAVEVTIHGRGERTHAVYLARTPG